MKTAATIASMLATVLALASITRADEAMPEPEMRKKGPRPPVQPVRVSTPAPDVAKLGTQMAGAYKCKGVQLVGDGSSTPLQASVTIKLDLDNAWVAATLAEDKAGGVKFSDFRTYDGVAKQWTRIQLTSASAHVISTSLGEKDGKWIWEGTAASPTGTVQVRDYEQLGKDSFKVWGEALMGGTWQKLYEATCKKELGPYDSPHGSRARDKAQ
jgi:hypothetical protein